MVTAALVAVAIAQKSAPSRNADWLVQFVGKSVSVQESSSGAKLVERLYHDFPGSNRPLIFGEDTVQVWRQGTGYVVVRLIGAVITPSPSSVVVYRYDLLGKPKGYDSFLLGWRSVAESCTQISVPGVSDFLLEVRSQPQINGEAPVRQAYGFDGDQIKLLRAEDREGKLQNIVFAAPNHQLGPTPHFTLAKLIAILKGRNAVRILEALIWLAGNHGEPSEHPYSVYSEDMAQMLSYWTVVNEPSVREAVQDLEGSPVPWISEAAKQAKPKDRKVSTAKLSRSKMAERLVIQDLRVGKGLKAAFGDVVRVTYKCFLPDGTRLKLKDRYDEGFLEICVGEAELIEGLRIGISGIREGGLRKLTIPAFMAFGQVGTSHVPPNCDIVYQIELLRVIRRA